MSVEIESALRTLLARSSDCVWRRDKDGYGQCWATDGAWHILGETVRGRERIIDRWAELMSPFAKVWQLSHNIVFGFDRDHPVARLHLEETLVTSAGPVNLLKGIYHDTYRFEDGAWRFARRHIDIAYLGPADFSGRWFPMIDHGASPHDPDRSRVSTPSMVEAYGTGG